MSWLWLCRKTLRRCRSWLSGLVLKLTTPTRSSSTENSRRTRTPSGPISLPCGSSSKCGESLDLALHEVRPGHVSAHINGYPASDKTKKVHLSAIRRFFDKLVERHAVILNPASSVKSPKVVVKEGVTPLIDQKLEQLLLGSIDTSNVVGLRDYCIIGTMIGTAARRGAVSKLDVRHLRDTGSGWELLFHEKGGKERSIPVRSDLLPFLRRYLDESGINDEVPPSRSEFRPLFRAAVGRTKKLGRKSLHADDIGAMAKPATLRCWSRDTQDRLLHVDRRKTPF